MGTSSSKSDSDRVNSAASWSTLDGFIQSEAGNTRRETIAVKTVVEEDKIEQVKTSLKFPESKPKSSFNLNLHLDQSVQHHKRKATPAEPLSPALKGIIYTIARCIHS